MISPAYTIRNLHIVRDLVAIDFERRARYAAKLAAIPDYDSPAAPYEPLGNKRDKYGKRIAAPSTTEWNYATPLPAPYVPAITTPAAKVGATETFKALAEKSRTAAASKPKRKLDSKSLASFNNSPRQGKGVRYHSSYGDGMRKVKAEAGI